MKKIDRRSFLRTASLATAALATGLNTPLSAMELAGEEQPQPGPKNPHPVPVPVKRGKTFEVKPVDHGGALLNPYMGWNAYYYTNKPDAYGARLAPSDTAEDFPGMHSVYLRVPWSMLEPEEGKFNWEMFDTPAQRWIEKGHQVCIRVTSTESWMYYATPKWVFDAGAKGYDVDKGWIIEPDYGDPVFLEKVENFVQAMAERYDSNPNVCFVDIGHLGMWGEGHTVMTSPKHGKEWGIEVQKQMIDLYCRHFKTTQLCISDDYAGPFLRGDRFDITDYAFSRGVTLRDDSILVSKAPEQWYHAEMAQLFWPTMPVIIEHEHYGLSKGRGNWDNDLLVESVEAYHASYMSIHWWPREEREDLGDAVERINRRLGYRLRMSRAVWPVQVDFGQEFVIESDWSNSAVAPCYKGGHPCFTLKDEKGGIIAALVDTALDVKDLPVAEPEKATPRSITSRFNIAPSFPDNPAKENPYYYYRAVPAGTYDLYISVGRADGTPLYELPYGGCDGHKRYRIGRITVRGERPAKTNDAWRA